MKNLQATEKGKFLEKIILEFIVISNENLATFNVTLCEVAEIR